MQKGDSSRNDGGRAHRFRAPGATRHTDIDARHFSGTKPMGDFAMFSMRRSNAGVALCAARSWLTSLKERTQPFWPKRSQTGVGSRTRGRQINASFFKYETNR